MENKVFVQRSAALNGVLRFQTLDERFNACREEYLDQYDTLTNWSKLVHLEKKMAEYGLEWHFVDDEATQQHQFLYHLISTEFKCSSPFLEEFSLYPFQHVGMNLCLYNHRVLVQWDTGAGKTVLGTLVAQRLFDDDEIDMVIVLCKKAKLVDWQEFMTRYTDKRVVRIDGARKKRHEAYRAADFDILVTNYEKTRYPQKNKEKKHDWSRTDLFQILEMVKGRRVLIVMDEAQKIGNAQSLISKGLRGLSKTSGTTAGSGLNAEVVRLLALTATPYTTSPYNIHNIFRTLVPGLPYVSTTKADFEAEYVRDFTWHGTPNWSEESLPKLGKRVENHSHVAMKSDPEIAAQFPEMVEREIPIELSDYDNAAYEAVLDGAWNSWDDNSRAGNLQNFQLLRMICNTAEALEHSSSELAADVVEALEGPKEPHTANSAKYQAVFDLCEKVVEADEKIVLFTYWANAVLPLYARELARDFGRDIPLFRFVGDMKVDEQNKNKCGFNDARGGAILLLSDAGQEGLNLYAPYLAHIEMPYTYAGYKQRRDRIHRSDSMARGIEKVWIYRFLTEDTVEGPVNARVFQRKRHSELISGKADVLSESDSLTMAEVKKMMFSRRRST